MMPDKKARCKNIFLTGEIQVGKSTIINGILENYHGRVGGFKTLPFRTGEGPRVFVMRGVEPDCENNSPHYICRDDNGIPVPIVETFETYGVSLLRNGREANVDLLLMDELGVFESRAKTFQKEVLKCLSSPIPVLGVLKAKHSEFLDNIRSRNDVQIFLINEENRNDMRAEMDRIIRTLLGI